MELIAAIDLVEGRATRLEQGDFERPLHPGADPVSLAQAWATTGVPRLHVVDLDGAREGRPIHGELLRRIADVAHGASPAVRVESSGGLREMDFVEATLRAGADEVILGSAAVADRGFLAACVERWPGRIGASLDVRDGSLSVDGWTRDLRADPLALAGLLLAAGAARLVITDVLRDGTAGGPNLELMARMRQRFPDARLVAAGGIATAGQLRALADAELDGAIVGRALLDGMLDVSDALAACAQGAPA